MKNLLASICLALAVSALALGACRTAQAADMVTYTIAYDNGKNKLTIDGVLNQGQIGVDFNDIEIRNAFLSKFDPAPGAGKEVYKERDDAEVIRVERQGKKFTAVFKGIVKPAADPADVYQFTVDIDLFKLEKRKRKRMGALQTVVRVTLDKNGKPTIGLFVRSGKTGKVDILTGPIITHAIGATLDSPYIVSFTTDVDSTASVNLACQGPSTCAVRLPPLGDKKNFRFQFFDLPAGQECMLCITAINIDTGESTTICKMVAIGSPP